jgi:hypothetical protein
MTASRLAKPLLVLLSSVFCIGIADVGIRVLFRDRLLLQHDERNSIYRYDPELGWFPIANSKKTFAGGRRIQVEHNGRGFRDVEHVVGTRPRMIFLGDSFIWGYDVEQPERVTEKLRAKVTDWSIYNLGVSGYGTDQEYLLLRRQYEFYRPQIVFLVFCRDNDDDDNSSNVRYGGYYKPYFTVDGAGLTLRGVPVPKSEKYFFSQHNVLAKSGWVRLIAQAYFNLTAPPVYIAPRSPTHAILAEMQRFIQSKGGQLVVGLQRSYPELEQFLTDQNIPYVDLSNPYTYPTGSYHWTPEGHTFVSEKIKEFLDKGHYPQAAVEKTR